MERLMTSNNIIDRFKQWGCNTVLAVLWHRYAPSLTIRRRFYDSYVYMNLRDNIDDISKSTLNLERREEYILEFLKYADGLIWDVGANVGLFSVRAAQLGRRCVAFELSPKACELMNMTKRKNALNFEIVDRPLSTRPRLYAPPIDASAENQVNFTANGRLKAISFQEAAAIYGIPILMKMDIEGGELDFFNSNDFKLWLMEYSIPWLVEVHYKKIGFVPIWEDMPHYAIDDSHYLYCGDRRKISKLIFSVTQQKILVN